MECLVVTILLDTQVETADFRFQLGTPHGACTCVYTAFAHRHQLCPQCKLPGNCAAVTTVIPGSSKNTSLLSWIYWHELKNALTIPKLYRFWFKHETSKQTLKELICQQKLHRKYLCLQLYSCTSSHTFTFKRKKLIYFWLSVSQRKHFRFRYNFLPLQPCTWNSNFTELLAASPCSANLWKTSLPQSACTVHSWKEPKYLQEEVFSVPLWSLRNSSKEV